ncbi:MAG: cysteine--tRNA ligase [Candidatus Diapherotrites archaeon]
MLKVHNSLSRGLEEFKPLKGKKVGMYVCGPTVYGPAHIGHARTYIAFDIIRRYLEFKGFDVLYVNNITDVHDDMIKRANEQGITIFELAEKNITEFLKDMEALGIKKASFNPRVTEFIPEIISMVKALQEKDFAYETDDGVYFKLEKFKGYGKLSGVKLKNAKTGTRVETDKYEKENVRDFALWKKAKPNEPSWDSPWGKGRPGWHIECSAMSSKLLGEQIDIHGGAVDLIFPHHENEIAQSEAATGKSPFVKYWLHTGFLNVSGEKMSKSLGNFITVPELLAQHNARIFRFFIASVHYRSRIDFSDAAMQKAKEQLEKLDRFVEALQEAEGGKESGEAGKLLGAAKKDFVAAMDDDFNFPEAWAVLFKFINNSFRLIDGKKLGKKGAAEMLSFLREIDSVFNVLEFEKKEEKLSPELMKLVEEREKARKGKDFAKADELRKKLLENGLVLDDTPKGVKWRKA